MLRHACCQQQQGRRCQIESLRSWSCSRPTLWHQGTHQPAIHIIAHQVQREQADIGAAGGCMPRPRACMHVAVQQPCNGHDHIVPAAAPPPLIERICNLRGDKDPQTAQHSRGVIANPSSGWKTWLISGPTCSGRRPAKPERWDAAWPASTEPPNPPVSTSRSFSGNEGAKVVQVCFEKRLKAKSFTGVSAGSMTQMPCSMHPHGEQTGPVCRRCAALAWCACTLAPELCGQVRAKQGKPGLCHVLRMVWSAIVLATCTLPCPWHMRRAGGPEHLSITKILKHSRK